MQENEKAKTTPVHPLIVRIKRKVKKIREEIGSEPADPSLPAYYGVLAGQLIAYESILKVLESA